MTGSFITTMRPLMHHVSCQIFFGKQQITQVTQPPYSPDLVPCHLTFPKTKITFEREEISDCWWDSGKDDRAVDGDWENCVRSQAAYFEGDWGIIVLCTMFLVSCIFFSKCLYFSYKMAIYFPDRPRISDGINVSKSMKGHISTLSHIFLSLFKSLICSETNFFPVQAL